MRHKRIKKIPHSSITQTRQSQHMTFLMLLHRMKLSFALVTHLSQFFNRWWKMSADIRFELFAPLVSASASLTGLANTFTFFSASLKLSCVPPLSDTHWIQECVCAATELGQIWGITGSAWFHKRLEILISFAGSQTAAQTASAWARCTK